GVRKEFECVELGDLQLKDECREKSPRRVIHFSSGETMEEYSTEDEEDHTHTRPEQNDLLSSVDASTLTWGPYVSLQMWRAASNTLSACDYMGERVASLFGITSPKYQYAIDEYNRTNKQIKNEGMDSPVSGEAESHFEEKQKEEIQEQNVDKTTVDDTENLIAETLSEPENWNTEIIPEPGNLDTETSSKPENLNAKSPPKPGNLHTGSSSEPENPTTDFPPDPENLNPESPPEPEILKAKSPSEPKNLDSVMTPEPENLKAKSPSEPKNLDSVMTPEPENLDV
ncbi:hypothetical protein C0J45_19791, partial [Silurus meridionalis]